MKINKKQNGFTLLEVLIAMLVLSIGLLGIAGLQASSLQYSLDASSRAQVTVMAEDIISKMRMQANKTNDAGVPALINSYTAVANGVCDPLIAGVTAELNCWHSNVNTTLLGGAATIAAPGGRNVVVTISWNERGVRAYSNDQAQANDDVQVNGNTVSTLREGTRFFTLTATL